MIVESKVGGTPFTLQARRKSVSSTSHAARRFAVLAIGLALFTVAFSENASAQQRRGGSPPEHGVYKARITPHWFAQNTQFWYRNDLRGGAKEFVRVNAETGTREPAFDHGKLAAALSKAAGKEFEGGKLPFSEIEFTGDGKSVKFSAADKTWQCDLNSYECMTASTNAATSDVSLQPQDQQSDRQRGRRRGSREDGSLKSPDEKWTALVRDHNVFVHSESDGKEVQLSQDGKEGNYYDRLEWSPDSQSLIAWRVEPGDRKEVYLVQSSPAGGGRASLHTRPY